MKFILATILFAITCAAVNCKMMEFIEKNMVLNKAELAEVVQFSKDCKKETNVQDEVFEQLLAGELPEVRELKCFFKCFSLKFGVLKENGDYDLTRLETTMRKKQYDIIVECSTIKEDDLCDQVFNVHKCYVNGLKKYNVVL